MELLIAILIAFGFVSTDDASTMRADEALRIFNENNLDEKASDWAKESGSQIWEEESGDFIWELEAGDF